MNGLPVKQSSVSDPVAQKCLDFFDRVFTDIPCRPFAIRLWNDAEWQQGKGSPVFTLRINTPGALRTMFWRPSELSLGEAFIYGDIDIDGELEGCFELAGFLLGRRWQMAEKLRLVSELLRLPGFALTKKEAAPQLRGRSHSKQRDAQAVQYHYNVSNKFYQLWLDRNMVYSCAYFQETDTSLDQAQVDKLDYLCRKLRLRQGETLLDIGCGWGGLILHAAKNYGVDAYGITLSPPQAELANERIRAAGLTERCRVDVLDYRDVPLGRQFDKIVSVGMFEHVGETKLPEYFHRAYQLLKPFGVFLNHGITETIRRAHQTGASFIDKYVFPDGELLPISTSLRVAEEIGFETRDVESLREHYALTLRHWYRRLESHQEEAIRLTSPVIYRIWRIYMAGSAYGFETRRLGLYQTLLVKSGRQGSRQPLTRKDWYH